MPKCLIIQGPKARGPPGGLSGDPSGGSSGGPSGGPSVRPDLKGPKTSICHILVDSFSQSGIVQATKMCAKGALAGKVLD